MLPDEREEVSSRLYAARQKLIVIPAEGESKGVCLQMLCQIASLVGGYTPVVRFGKMAYPGVR